MATFYIFHIVHKFYEKTKSNVATFPGCLTHSEEDINQKSKKQVTFFKC